MKASVAGWLEFERADGHGPLRVRVSSVVLVTHDGEATVIGVRGLPQMVVLRDDWEHVLDAIREAEA